MIKFAYRMEHLIKSPSTIIDGAAHFNARLMKLEALSSKITKIGGKLLSFVDFALKFLANNENVDTRALISILVGLCVL